MFTDTLPAMNFILTQADPDIYRQKSRKTDGEDYYELLLVYVYNVLACSHDPQAIMDDLALTYDLKEGSVTVKIGQRLK